MKNPPAFPTPVIVPEGQFTTISNNGMTLRDYFAAKALPSLVTSALDLDHKLWDATAQHAYLVADAMLKAREQ